MQGRSRSTVLVLGERLVVLAPPMLNNTFDEVLSEDDAARTPGLYIPKVDDQGVAGSKCLFSGRETHQAAIGERATSRGHGTEANGSRHVRASEGQWP